MNRNRIKLLKRLGAIFAIVVGLLFSGVWLKQSDNVVMSKNTGIPKDTDTTEYAVFDEWHVEYFKKFEKIVADSMSIEIRKSDSMQEFHIVQYQKNVILYARI